MKHSELKVGMKVKRTSEFCDDYYTSSKGSICTVKEVLDGCFTVKEEDFTWEAEYFDKVEDAVDSTQKEKLKMNKIDMKDASSIANAISMTKKYKTRDGKPARVLCVDRTDSEYNVVALVSHDGSESVECYNNYGQWSYPVAEEDELDLIEVSPYEDFKVDDKVMVRDFEGEEWLPRYFAYVSNDGLACTYTSGRTSWTAEDNDITSWSHCRKPTQEELGN